LQRDLAARVDQQSIEREPRLLAEPKRRVLAEQPRQPRVRTSAHEVVDEQRRGAVPYPTLSLIPRAGLAPGRLSSPDLWSALRARSVRGQNERADRGGTQQRPAIECLNIGRARDLLSHWRLLLRCPRVPFCRYRRVLLSPIHLRIKSPRSYSNRR